MPTRIGGKRIDPLAARRGTPRDISDSIDGFRVPDRIAVREEDAEERAHDVGSERTRHLGVPTTIGGRKRNTDRCRWGETRDSQFPFRGEQRLCDYNVRGCSLQYVSPLFNLAGELAHQGFRSRTSAIECT